MNVNDKALLHLLSRALWTAPEDTAVMAAADPAALYELAIKQAVPTFAYTGLAAFKSTMPAEVLNKWRTSTISVIMNNKRMMTAQDRVLTLMGENRIPCAILKGSSLSVCYPKPELRPLGDIDLLVRPEDTERAKELLLGIGYRQGHEGHAFHQDFHGYGTVVELHWAVSSFPEAAGAQEAKRFMATALDTTDTADMNGPTFPVLKPAYQALSVLLHLERHMTQGGIGLRQLCDWMMLVASMDVQVFAASVLPVLRRCGLYRFAQALTAACVQYLGMPQEKAPWCADVTEALTQTMLEEILRGGNMGRADESGGLSNAFVERGGKEVQGNPIVLMVKRCAKSAQHRFPIVKKYPVLLPFFTVYTPIYLLSSGKKKWTSFRNLTDAAKERRRTYNELRLYDVKRE